MTADVLLAARLLRQLPGFLRHPLTPAEAGAILARRLERRETDFLELVRDGVYASARNPYHQLLRLAGCEYGDLERLVRADGVEGALSRLYRHGVYLTVDELKGRRPAVRGSGVVETDQRSLRNPWIAGHLEGLTSGSRGTRLSVSLDLAFLRDRAVNATLAWAPRGIHGWGNALWEIPGSAALTHVLRLSAMGITPERWFSQVDPAAAGLHPRYRWSARALGLAGRMVGASLPSPRYVPLDEPLPIVHWMAEVLRAGRTPHVETFPTSAVRVCQAALAEKVDVAGAQFSVIGEPFTLARQAVICQAGAEAVSRYGTTECPGLGWGCLAAAAAPDDHHQSQDLWAVVQPGPDGATRELPARAVLVSSLRRHSPLILINASMGDQAELEPHACGCPLEALGWTRHFRGIRSFEKLTAGGMTFFDSEILEILEEALPRRFGGGPTDYQLVEDEGTDGRSTLRLLVHPAVGAVDPDAVTDAFLAAVGTGSGVERVMAIQWRQAAMLRVERRPPLATPGGKILHLHQAPRPPRR